MDMYMLPNGRVVDYEYCINYIARNATKQQIAAWIDDHEEPIFLFGETIDASDVAFALFDWEQLRSDIADFIRGDLDDHSLPYFGITPMSSPNSKSKDRLDKAFKQSGSKPRKNAKVKFRRK